MASIAISAPVATHAVVRARPQARLGYIEGMRGVAALYVVLGHICSLVDPSRAALKPSHAPLWLQAIMHPLMNGRLAVASFIVISGFCLQLGLVQRRDLEVRDYWSFMGRRCQRILPPYYACLFLSIFVALTITPIPHGLPFTQYLPVTRGNVIAHLLMIQNLSPAWMYKLNGVLWSISIEFQLYFLFPFLARGGKKFGWPAVLLATVLASMLVSLFVPGGFKMYPWFLCLFALGMAGAELQMRWRLKSFVGLALAGIGLLLLAVGFAREWDPWLLDVCIGGAVAGLLMEGVAGRVAQIFALRPLVFLGAFSYSIYLMHHPILQVLDIFRPRTIVSQPAHFFYLLLFALPLVLVGTYGFGLIFERKWVLASHQALNKRSPARA